MGHYAKIEEGIVAYVIRADEEFISTYDDGKPGRFLKVSYNTWGGVHYQRDENDQLTGEPSEDQSKALRYNYPSPGWIYSLEHDAFYCPKPPNEQAYTLNYDTFLWEPPIPYPGGPDGDGNFYEWSDDAYYADTADPKTEGWILIDDPTE